MKGPTHVRYLIVLAATVMAVMLYLHRFCLSFVERYVKEDLGLSEFETAWLLSSFFWAYALAQVPGGWLSDRFGARLVLALYILAWSLFTGLTGAAVGFAVVLALRFGCGLAQAGAYPTSAGLLSKWMPFGSRGFASGVISVGGRIGGAAAPVLTAYLIVAFVPPSVPSLLRDDDLLDVHGLCADLCQDGDAPSAQVGRTVLGLLPDEAAGVVRALAQRPPVPRERAVQRRVLLAGLNEVLRKPALFQAVDLDNLPVPQEARTLAKLPPAELSPPQVERLDRLVLEAAFPAAIKKIYVQGWRPVMLVYGAAGLLVAVFFWLVVRDRPKDHPGCNPAEVALIEQSRPAAEPRPDGRVRGLPLRRLLESSNLWLISAAQFGTNFGWTFLLVYLPRYLAEVHRVPVLERGWMASVPLLVGMLGMLAGGWLTDRLTRRVGLRWGRRLPLAASRFVATAAYLACLVLGSPWEVTAALAVVAVATDLGTPAVWAYKQDVGGPYVGSILGWGNMWGNLGAALSPLVLNWVIVTWGWPAMFVTCAAAFLLAGVTALGVDATVPIAPPSKMEPDCVQ